jgi:hypothetical protein
MLAILASYGLYGEEAVHAARGLRSVAHVFASLEVAGGLGMVLDPKESFGRRPRAIATDLRDQRS